MNKPQAQGADVIIRVARWYTVAFAKRARERASAIAEAAKLEALGPAVTVADAIEEYCAARENRAAKNRGVAAVKKDARSRLSRHVLHQPRVDAKLALSLVRDVLALAQAEEACT